MGDGRRRPVRHYQLAWLLGLSILLPGCASHPSLQSYQPKNRDEAQVVSVLLKIPNGIKARDLGLILQPYADDVYVGNFQKYLGVAGPTAPLSLSKADLRPVYDQVLRSAKEVEMDVKDFQLTLTGDRAVAQAATELLFKVERGRGEKGKEVYRNEVTWRLRRTPAGWKIVEEIWQ
jgi:ketosteroid isomerase-like protein